MIELNKPYSSKELAQLVFNVSAKTFSNRRDYYLERLSEYYE